MSKAVGIDLGTTFSGIAIVNDYGKPEIIPNRDGERITPSVILFEGDTPIVGMIAKQAAVTTPLNVAQFIKRQMGDASYKFTTEDGTTYTPEELSAMILKRLKADAEETLGESITDAVITVPAYFNDAQRKSTQDAGKIAGLNVLHIINEPTAAALAYGVDKVEEEQTVLVYDLGGGTFDVTIMKVGHDEINVIATGGDKNLGGFDFDNEVMKYLNEQVKQECGVDLFDDPVLEQDLRDKAELAKKTLSTRTKTNVFLSAGGKNLTVPLTREKFQELTQTWMDKTATILSFVLEDSGLNWSEIDKVLLVGGSTRMPAVSELIETVSGQKPSLELNQDEVVAMGAALQAAILSAERGLPAGENVPDIVIHDVNSHSLGIVALNDFGILRNFIVLKKDTPIPCEAQEIFHTIEDNQRVIDVKVTQGEDEDLDYVNIVGEAEMEIAPYPKGTPVEITIHYDSDGIIHVTAFDMTAKRSLGEINIKRESNLTEEEVQAKAKQLAKVEVE